MDELTHGEIFDRRAADYGGYSDWCKNLALYEACVEPLADMLPHVKCLDLGGGSGWIARRNSAHTGRNWTVLDISREMKRFVQPPVRFVLGDAHSLPFGANEFAHVVMRSFLQFVDAKAVLEGVRRVLTPRGHMVIAQKVKAGSVDDLAWHEELHFLRNPTSPQDWTVQRLEDVIKATGYRLLAARLIKERRAVDLERWITKDGTIGADKVDRIRALILNPPPDVLEATNQVVEGGALMYDRTWAVCYSRKESVVTSLTPAVAAMIVEREVDGEKSVLLQRRKKRYEEPLYYNSWEIPQGKIERGESGKETVARELEDETGLRLDTISPETPLVENADKVFSDRVEAVRPLICVRVAGGIDFLAVALIVSASGEPRSVDIDREYRWLSCDDLRHALKTELMGYPFDSGDPKM